MSGKRTVIDSEVTYGKDDMVIESEILKKTKSSKKTGEKRKKKKIKKRALITLSVFLCLLAVLYLLFTFANFYPFMQLREIYIETAMTTDNHHWLAEWFFPKSVIEKVMKKQAARLK